MKIEMTVTRVYEMDDKACLEFAAFAPPGPETSETEQRNWIRETFYELCGWDRDEDHVDGTFVRLLDESADTDFHFARRIRE